MANIWKFELMVDTEALDDLLSLYEEDEAVVEIDVRDERARERLGELSNGCALIGNKKIKRRFD